MLHFNFLSTDFSHSKSVKEISVRLYVKTKVLSSENIDDQLEVCYCKMKMFWNQEAEQKHSNNVIHVKKIIDKLKQQIAQAKIDSELIDK